MANTKFSQITASAANMLSTDNILGVSAGPFDVLFSGAQLAAGVSAILNLGTAAFVNTGTSGATVPLLNGANTHSATNVFNAATSSIDLGANGGNPGVARLFGSTSGSVTVRAAAAAGTGTVFQYPATNGTSGWVLQTDGFGVTSWVAPSGGGGSGTVTTVSVTTANGVSGTVTNPTTTPALTLSLGAITPTSVAIGGATLGSNALAVTGTVLFNGTITGAVDANTFSSNTVQVTSLRAAGLAVFSDGGNFVNGLINTANPLVGVLFTAPTAIGWSSVGVGATQNAATLQGAIDLQIWRDAAGILAQRKGTSAQTFRVYNTYTDASNYERGMFDWNITANTLTFGTQAAGTGIARNITIAPAGGTTSITGALAVSGTITGTSTTQSPGDNSTKLATTAYVDSAVAAGGGGSPSITTKTTAYTATTTDYAILANAASGAFTVTAPASPTTGQILVVKKIDTTANLVTVSGNGKNIDGVSSQVISSQWSSLVLQYDGTSWYLE